MADIDDGLHDLLARRHNLPGSSAAMETKGEAETINRDLCALEGYTMRLAACWDGEMDGIGAYSQLAYLHAFTRKPREPSSRRARSAKRSNG
jgi:hypothetical protein